MIPLTGCLRGVPPDSLPSLRCLCRCMAAPTPTQDPLLHREGPPSWIHPIHRRDGPPSRPLSTASGYRTPTLSCLDSGRRPSSVNLRIVRSLAVSQSAGRGTRGLPDAEGLHLREVLAEHKVRQSRSAKSLPVISRPPPRAPPPRIVPLLALPVPRDIPSAPFNLYGLPNSKLPSYHLDRPEDDPKVQKMFRIEDSRGTHIIKDVSLRVLTPTIRSPHAGPRRSFADTLPVAAEKTKKKRKEFQIPSPDDTSHALRGMTIPPSFGTQPNYWDRYRLYKDVVRKFGASPSLTTCLQ